jgi:hypothetical protein
MFCHKLINYERMRCSWIKQYCSGYRVDMKRTQYHTGVILGLLHWYMINLATHIVLLASLARSMWSMSLSGWLPRSVTILPMSQHCSLRTIVGIVSQLTTLETSIGLNRSSVPNRCPRAIVWMTLLRSRSSRCLRVEALWLKRALQLHTFHLVYQDGTETNSAMNWSEDECYCLTVHVTGTCVFARPVPSSCFPAQFPCAPVSGNLEGVTLQLIVKRPNQPIQKHFLSFRISVHLIRCITRQMSELVQVLSDRHVSLPQWQELLLLKLDYPLRDVIGTEVVAELLPSDILPVGMCSCIRIPPISNLSHKSSCSI